MIGCDIIEVARIKKLKSKTKIFTTNELAYASKFSTPEEHLAGFFALKEAIVKAIDIPLNISQIEVLHKENGAVYVDLKIDNKNDYIIDCSISHIKELAMAVAICNRKS